jgi:hypothetical protein
VLPITLDTSESELFRIAVMIVDDYQRATGLGVPGGILSFMRRAGVESDVATAFTPYDYVELYANVLSWGSMDTTFERERTLFHESGHVFRHIMDGDRFPHWDNDLVRFSYARCHRGTEVFAEGFAFNEGWANYWRRARWSGVAERVFNPTPSFPPTGRATPVVTTMPVGGTPTPATTLTDYCNDGTVGNRGVPLTPLHVDWVENMVADRLLGLANSCAGLTPDAADAAMLSVLRANPEGIHRLWEFEVALCAAGICCGTARTVPPADCPPGFNDDGESCSQDGQIINEP